MKSKGANKTAIVKPAITKPASRKSATESAAADKPADAQKRVQPTEKHHRFAGSNDFDRKSGQDRFERHAPVRSVHIAKWQGGDVAHLRTSAGAYGFSGFFGGCQYRGVVSATGYRIESSC